MSTKTSLKVGNLPVSSLAFTNRVYLSKARFDALAGNDKFTVGDGDFVVNVLINDTFVYMAAPLNGVPDQEIAMNAVQRKCGSFTLQQDVAVTRFKDLSAAALSSMTVTVDLFVKKPNATMLSLDCKELSDAFTKAFVKQIFRVGQSVALDFNGTKLDLNIEHVEHPDFEGVAHSVSPLGQVLLNTDVQFKRASGSQSPITIVGGAGPVRNDNLFRSDFNFEAMGIGGLDEQFKKMFRTAFASRVFPGLVKQLGTNHVRGILLYGPPGCGKTLIARQIGKILNSREPKIVNGPEILDKYVGGSEEKIRALFADAEKEQKEMGDASMLHIIIFDEMDAIMKTRGTNRDGTGVGDSVVNQLLSKIDGVDSLNNILLIGMTNRKDMIDEAILRPGRLEIHIEISLPDEHGRDQILAIKTAEMRKNNRITELAISNMHLLAAKTKNFTGAELEGLVRNAASFALSRHINPQSLKNVDEKEIKVDWPDFQKALEETVPAFGNKDNAEINAYFANGVFNFGSSFDDLWSSLLRLVNQVRQSARTPLLTTLLEGNAACGKTAIAAKLAVESDFPFVRMISADSMIGFSEAQKCSTLLKIFTDSYRSPQSIIFIDDVERLIEYSPVGLRYSNTVLQTLLVLLKKVPTSPSRLFVIATTSIASLLEDLQLSQAFNVSLHVSLLQTPAEFAAVLREYSKLPPSTIQSVARAISKPIGIKQLLLVLEMALAEFGESVTADQFLMCLQTLGF